MATGPTGPMGYISAGRYQQTGGTLNIIGPTGSIISTVSAVEINVSGTLSANVVNANTLSYSNLDLSGNLTVEGDTLLMGSLTTASGFSVDLSGNVVVQGELTAQDVIVQGELSTGSGFSVDISGNVIVSGTLAAQDVIVDGSLDTTSGFSVDLSGNVIVSGSITADSGFAVDISGNTVVSGNFVAEGSATITGYVTANAGVNIVLDLAVDQNVTVAQNVGITGQQYLGGNLYSNNGIVVGDSLNGDGVALNVWENEFDPPNHTGLYVGYTHSSDYVDASGVRVDASGVPIWTNQDIYPKVALSVNGNIWADQSILTNTSIYVDPVNSGYSLSNTNYDSSGVYFLDLQTANGSQVVSSSDGANWKIPIIINGEIYSILLHK